MQVVIVKQNGGRGTRAALVANKLKTILKSGDLFADLDYQLTVFYNVTGGISMTALLYRAGAIEKFPGEGNNLFTTHWIVAAGALCTVLLRDYVGAIQGIVQAAPTGIRGIEGKTGILHGDHELRSSLD